MRRHMAFPAATVAVALVTLAGCGSADDTDEGSTEDIRTFHSRGDLTAPPITAVDGDGNDFPAPTSGTVPDDLVFTGPKSMDTADGWSGALITDETGEPVWIDPDTNKGTRTAGWDLRVQEYRDEPVLTWWEGHVATPESEGSVVIADQSYQEIARVSVGGELAEDTADVHESTITEDDTMLLLHNHKAPADLSELGGPEDGWVWENSVQEVDIATGEVLLQWDSLDDVPATDSEEELEDGKGTEDDPYDYFHGNSVTVDDDGNLLVSARNTHTVYKLDRDDASLIWRLGGKESDFEFGENAGFAYQHDVQRSADGTLTMFDNEASPKVGQTRGLRLDVDEKARTVDLVHEYLPPVDRISFNQGSFQDLPDGEVFIGWGARPDYTKYAEDGSVLLDAAIGGVDSNYRAYEYPWEGHPLTNPDASVSATGDSAQVHASWNGATEVAAWRVLSGPDDTSLSEAGTADRTGFETTIDIGGYEPVILVQALGEDGKVLGTTEVE